MTPRLGIDFGKVIISAVDDGNADTSFLSGTTADAMRTPPSPQAFETIKELVQAFEGEAWIISKASPRTQAKTRAWLQHWQFFQTVDMTWDRLRFCQRRNEKAVHCRELAITHFIDDRIDVLDHLRDTVEHLYLFGDQPALGVPPDWVTHVNDWPDVGARILRQFD